ncbi:antibiotic biosynthesis monooxygenase [Corynebacterium glyciniphilum]|uniref:antibiotic biosynthesis monooxygenase n=1 Tax=Corynebacterium glyciniphilum TaxID=1404244 RepID=UPI0011AB4E47|nr:antibiotic biosynthesis monooxygenase [Corynebacterium glyciniphilum]
MSATFVNIIDLIDAVPEKQQEVVDLLVEGTEKVISKRPGFISSKILASVDRSRVLNIATWEDAEAASQTQAEPAAARYAQRVAALATARPGLFTVAAEFPDA